MASTPYSKKSPEALLAALNDTLRQARALWRGCQPAQSEALCYQILIEAPGEPNTLHLLAMIASGQGQTDRAVAYLRRACLAQTAPAIVFSDLGELLRQTGQTAEAEALVRKAIVKNELLPNAWNTLGVILKDTSEGGERRRELLAEARAAFDRAIVLNSEFVEPYWNRGTLALLEGDFERAWPDFEWRKRILGHNLQIPSSRPIWSGLEDISNKTILVYWEQGLGDTIQFCRYIELLSARAGHVLFWPQPALKTLLAMADLGGASLVDAPEGGPAFDYRLPVMSLPVVFKTTVDTIPATASYLHPDPVRVERWRKRLGSHGFKIGICWKGSSGPIDAGRSIPLMHFLQLLEIPDVRLISLQKHEGLFQLHSLGDDTRIETLGEDFDAGPDAFVDTAAVITLCDLVVSSDTSVAHLAGALGVPVWVGLKYAPDWRWLLDRSDSPWYPSMRLFRQTAPDDWAGVFERMRESLAGCETVDVSKRFETASEVGIEAAPLSSSEALESSTAEVDLAASPVLADPGLRLPTPHVPISWGELIDKITILELESEKHADSVAVSRALKEMMQQADNAAPRWKFHAPLLSLKAALRAVNEEIWRLKDAICNEEDRAQHDDRYMGLVRAFFAKNEERALIREDIDAEVGGRKTAGDKLDVRPAQQVRTRPRATNGSKRTGPT